VVDKSFDICDYRGRLLIEQLRLPDRGTQITFDSQTIVSEVASNCLDIPGNRARSLAE
jgi:hypothetical protein